MVIPRGTSIDYLEQEPNPDPDDTVLDMVMRADPKIINLHKQLQELEAQMGDPAVTSDPDLFQDLLDKYGIVQDQFDQAGGYNYESKIKSVLKGIGFSDEQLDQPATN